MLVLNEVSIWSYHDVIALSGFFQVGDLSLSTRNIDTNNKDMLCFVRRTAGDVQIEFDVISLQFS